MTPDDPDHDTVHRPERDSRVRDATRFLHDRRVEAESMIDLWQRSTKPRAADELTYWRDVLKDVDRKIDRLQSDTDDDDQHADNDGEAADDPDRKEQPI